METKFRAAVLLATGITFVGGETILLAHHDIDVPQQPHTEHEYYPAPEESSFTLAASGIGNISILPLQEAWRSTASNP